MSLEGSVSGNKNLEGSLKVKEFAFGVDGFSPIATVEETSEGVTITITDKNNTTTATLKHGKDGKIGKDGEDGKDGKDGYTPQKGIDYHSGTVIFYGVVSNTPNTNGRYIILSYTHPLGTPSIGDLMINTADGVLWRVLDVQSKYEIVVENTRISVMPQKGVDYFTESEREEFKQEVLSDTDNRFNDVETSIYNQCQILGNRITQTNANVNKKIDKPAQAPKVGDVLKVKSVNADGTLVLEWAEGVAKTAIISEVELLASKWEGEGYLFSQVVNIEGSTENSQVDLTPSVEQLAIFYEKDLAFVTENEDGVVTVYAIGQKPQNDYTIQVTITEVTYE